MSSITSLIYTGGRQGRVCPTNLPMPSIFMQYHVGLLSKRSPTIVGFIRFKSCSHAYKSSSPFSYAHNTPLHIQVELAHNWNAIRSAPTMRIVPPMRPPSVAVTLHPVGESRTAGPYRIGGGEDCSNGENSEVNVGEITSSRSPFRTSRPCSPIVRALTL